MTRLASLIAGGMAVSLLLCAPGCMSGPTLHQTLRGTTQALRQATLFGGGEDAATRLSGQLSLARLSERGGQYAQARSLYARYLLQRPDDPVPYHRLAVMAAREKQYDKAEEYFQKARSMGTPSSELLSDFGYFYYLQDRTNEAEQLLRLAVEQSPEDVAANNNLGLLLGEQGRFAESFEAFQRAVSPAEAHANLAFVMAQVGEHDRALEHYSQALTLQRDLRPAAEAMLHLAERGRRTAGGGQRPEDGGPNGEYAEGGGADTAGPSVVTVAMPAKVAKARPIGASSRSRDRSAVAPAAASRADRPDMTQPADSADLDHALGRMPSPTLDSAPRASTTRPPVSVASASYSEESTSAAAPIAAARAAPPPAPVSESSPSESDWQQGLPAEGGAAAGRAPSSSALFRRLLTPQ